MAAPVNGAIQQIPEGARMFVNPPPAVDGLGVPAGGFKVQVQDRGGPRRRRRCTARELWGIARARSTSNPKTSIGTPFSTYDINVPQLYAAVDRTKAKQMGVAARLTSTRRCRSTLARCTSTTSAAFGKTSTR